MQGVKGGKTLPNRLVELLAPTDTSMGSRVWYRERQESDPGPGKSKNLLAALFWWLVSVGMGLLIARLC